jgi:histidinol-phosphate aminotransferase
MISRTFSKAFGLAGLRIGYLIASEDIISMVNKIRNPKNISSLAQVAAVAALNDIEYLQKNIVENLEGKAFLVESIQKKMFLNCTIIYGGGNFVLLKLLNCRAEELVSFLQNRGIFIRNLSHLTNLTNYVRITTGDIQTMQFLIKNLNDFFGIYG